MKQIVLVSLALLVAPAVLTIAAPSAEAQIGRIRNNAVGRAVDRATAPRGDSASAPEQQRQAPAAAAARTTSSPAIVEINDESLGRLELAMRKEVEVRAAFASEQGDHSAVQQRHTQCTIDFVQSAEYMAHMEKMSAAMDKEDWDAVRKLGEEQQKMMQTKCGPPPSGPQHMSNWDFEQRSADAGQFTDRQYAILKERVIPFCNANVAADPNGVSIPGRGKNYVYSGSEAQALRPRCGALMQTLRGIS